MKGALRTFAAIVACPAPVTRVSRQRDRFDCQRDEALKAFSRIMSLARVALAAVYLAAQGALIASAAQRPEHAFGFRMFSESSRMSAHLFRETDSPTGHGTTLVDVKDGAWDVPLPDGNIKVFRWSDRVKEPHLRTFDREIDAPYGAAAQLARWKAALDDVIQHIPDDNETLAFVADVTIRRAGRAPEVIRVEGARR